MKIRGAAVALTLALGVLSAAGPGCSKPDECVARCESVGRKAMDSARGNPNFEQMAAQALDECKQMCRNPERARKPAPAAH